MDIAILSFFVLAFFYCATPGPANIYVVLYSLRYGINAGLYSTYGITVGCGIAALIVGLGISSLLVVFPNVIVTIQIFGGLFVIYLSVKMWPTAASTHISCEKIEQIGHATLFKNGVISSLLNPVDILFFSAIVPSFIPNQTTENSFQIYYTLLSLFYIMVAFAVSCALVVFAGISKKYLFSRKANLVSYLSAILLCLVGIYLTGMSVVKLYDVVSSESHFALTEVPVPGQSTRLALQEHQQFSQLVLSR